MCYSSLPILSDTSWLWWLCALLFVQIPRHLLLPAKFSLIGYILSIVLIKFAEPMTCAFCTFTKCKGAEHKHEPGSSNFSFPYQAFIFLFFLKKHMAPIWVSLISRFWSLKRAHVLCWPYGTRASNSQRSCLPSARPSPSYWQK